MKVIVFGASGTIGQELVQQSLSEGYQVTAFCRNPETLQAYTSQNLHLYAGDVFDPDEVQKAVKGQDIVIIALGSGKSRKSIVRSVGTKNVIAAMHQHGVKRLICQTTLGTGESRGNLNFFWKHIMFGWFLKQIFKDHELQEDYVTHSGLDWTIVRPSAFTDGEKTGRYRHGFASNVKNLNLTISRADVADFILKQTKSLEYLRQAPGLSN